MQERARGAQGGGVSKFPEHEKLADVKGKSQAIGEFLEWTQEQGWLLAQRHEHSEHCPCDDSWHDTKKQLSEAYADSYCKSCGGSRGSRRNLCGYGDNDLAPVGETVTRLLARYFEIDEDLLEAEKRAMLEELRRGADEERARAEAAASDSETRAAAEAEGLAGFEAGGQP